MLIPRAYNQLSHTMLQYLILPIVYDIVFVSPISITHFREDNVNHQYVVWELLSSAIMWVIWKARCLKVSDNVIVYPVESIDI